MKIYVLYSEVNDENRPEILVPKHGYLYFDGELRLYDTFNIRQFGEHPTESSIKIKESSAYKAIDLDEEGEETVIGLINLLKSRKLKEIEMKRLKNGLKEFLKAYDDKMDAAESKLDEINRKITQPLMKLKKITETE
jgi:cell fate (sporulation/competence/biofilm development) regulator YlbF (YheA/YmcA/DUF963 family)